MVKQVVQNYKTGVLSVQEVPPPQLRPGGVLVRTAYSLISAGTERGMIDLARSGKLATIPTHERPLNQAQAALDDLRAGRIVGRAVLTTEGVT